MVGGYNCGSDSVLSFPVGLALVCKKFPLSSKTKTKLMLLGKSPTFGEKNTPTFITDHFRSAIIKKIEIFKRSLRSI